MPQRAWRRLGPVLAALVVVAGFLVIASLFQST